MNRIFQQRFTQGKGRAAETPRRGRSRRLFMPAARCGIALLILAAAPLLRADDADAPATPPPAAPAPAPAADAPAAPEVHFPFLSPAQPNLGIRPLSPEAAPSSPLDPSIPPASAAAGGATPAPNGMRPILNTAPSLSLRQPVFDAPSTARPPLVAAPAAPAPAPAPKTVPQIADSVTASTRALLNLGNAMPGAAAGGNRPLQQNYAIHIGDTLAITMADEPSFNFHMVVQNNGAISLPYIKEEKVAGKTVQEAASGIAQRLADYYVNPMVNVDVVQYRIKQVVLLGQVNLPGVYPFNPEQDSMSLLEAIAKAGGVKQNGDMGHVTVKRVVDGKEQIIVVNAREAKALSRGQDGLSFQVLPDDTIVIALFRNEINLLGEVRHPGIYTLPPQLDSIDLIEAIAMAGGLVEDKDLGFIHVKRIVDDKETTLNVDAKAIGRNKAGASFPLYAGDTIIIETTSNDFIVLGQVNRPGSYPIPPFHDSVDLIEALAMAGGATRLADTTHITIRRQVDGKTVLIKANAQKLTRSADDIHVDVLPGDRIVVSERIF